MGSTLVIMAAGMGSRYGGLKQIEPVGKHGESIMDYSIYDALRAGFDKVVFIIKKEIEEAFRGKIGAKIEKVVDTEYAFQEIDSFLPDGFILPAGRTKPWGTGHALLSAKEHIHTPFAVINADDFYGASAFETLGRFLDNIQNDSRTYCMVGYELYNTLTESGYVSRGVCQADANGFLTGVVEHTHIEKDGGRAKYTEDGVQYFPLPADRIVSMNTWGFAPNILDALEQSFLQFLQAGNLEKAEFYLPTVVNRLIEEKAASVKVLPCRERWYGVTYQEDRRFVTNAVEELVQAGRYPADLSSVQAWKAARL